MTELKENPRSTWSKGSDLEVYGSKAKKWYSGKIKGVDEDDDGEWLKITYRTEKNEMMMRKVQRYSDQIRPIGGDNKYKPLKSLENANEDEDKKDESKDNKNNKKKSVQKLNKAKEEVVYPADKYLEEAEKEVLESHEKGDYQTTIKLLKKLKCNEWNINMFSNDNSKGDNEVGYVCDDGYILHAEVLRVNKDKTKIFIHLGNDYRHYDFNLKQKSIWLNVPTDRIYSIDALQKYPNPKAQKKSDKNVDEEIPNDALEFFKQLSGVSAGELERHPSIGAVITDMAK